MRGSSPLLVCLRALTLLFGITAEAQLFNSGTVMTSAAAPPAAGSNWVVYAGSADSVFPSLGPNGAQVMQFTVTAPPAEGPFTMQYTLSSVTDLRVYDTLSVLIKGSATRIGDFAYLVDTQSRRRWYSLIIRDRYGWQQPVFSIAAFVGQDSDFDLSQVAAVRVAQSGVLAGDQFLVAVPTFEVGLIDHCDVASAWYIDIGSGTLETTTDAFGGTGSVIANLATSSWGQADIAIIGFDTEIAWNLSTKSYLSFYFKDSNPSLYHYFLIYDKNHNFREWTFLNPAPGSWIAITADLRDAGYFESGPVDLTAIQQFEVGIFGGVPGQSYAFQVDEVRVK